MVKEIEEFEITKTTVECYKVRHPTGMYWADITIDSGERSGRIQIASDYGSFQHYWGACGESFKKFLLSIDKYYAAGKFGQDRWFDVDKTISSMRTHIEECCTDMDENEVLYSELKKLEEQQWDNENDFLNDFFSKKHLSSFYDGLPDTVRDLTPQFEKFWNSCWQVFLNQIRYELASTIETKSVLKN
jgi:hypothetical protein